MYVDMDTLTKSFRNIFIYIYICTSPQRTAADAYHSRCVLPPSRTAAAANRRSKP